MKNLVTVFLTLISLAGLAQTKAPVVTQKNSPVYFIDSVKIDDSYINYLDPNDIALLTVGKDNPLYPNGAIYITLKDHSIANRLLQDKLLSLNNIWEANISGADKHKPVLYLVDDKLLTDTVGVRIPSAFVRNVTVVKAAETAYFRTALPNVLLMRISTKPQTIILRGQIAAK
jgi:hypothetical protein